MGKLHQPLGFLKETRKFLGGGESPQADTAAGADLEEAKKQAKKSRVALLETEGGIAGEELKVGEVRKRPTLLGN